jgi:hypothetical protein
LNTEGADGEAVGVSQRQRWQSSLFAQDLPAPIQTGIVCYFSPLFPGYKELISQEDTVQLDGLDWDRFLCIGLADGGEGDAGLEYARGSRVVNKMQDDAGKQVPGLKQALQLCQRLCNININPMDVMQDPWVKQEACKCQLVSSSETHI